MYCYYGVGLCEPKPRQCKSAYLSQGDELVQCLPHLSKRGRRVEGFDLIERNYLKVIEIPSWVKKVATRKNKLAAEVYENSAFFAPVLRLNVVFRRPVTRHIRFYTVTDGAEEDTLDEDQTRSKGKTTTEVSLHNQQLQHTSSTSSSCSLASWVPQAAFSSNRCPCVVVFRLLCRLKNVLVL